MFRLRKFLPFMAVLVGAVILLTPAPATAAFKLKITSSAGGTVTIEDNMVGDMDSTDGVISTGTITVGGFRLTLTGGLSKPELENTPYYAEMDIQIGSVRNVSAGAAAILTIELTDTEFILSPSPGNYILSSTLNGPANLPTGAAVDGQAYVDNGNGEFVTSGPTNGKINAIGGTAPSLTFSGVSPFSATLVEHVQLNQGVQLVSIDLNMQVTTPVPASLFLALSGMPIIGLGAWLRRRRLPAPA